MTILRRIDHSHGRPQTRARFANGLSSLRLARRRGLSEMDRATDDTEMVSSRRWHDAHEPVPATDFGEWDKLRPPLGYVYARRRSAYESAKAAGLVIPTIADHERNQRGCAVYDVLTVASDVQSVKPGDAVLAHAYIGRDMRRWLGPEVFGLRADEYGCNVDTGYQHGSLDARREGCSCGGDIHGIVEP